MCSTEYEGIHCVNVFVFYLLCMYFKVCFEGEISKASVMQSLSRGKRASGDLIPWTVSQQVGGAQRCGRSSCYCDDG